MSDFAEAAKAVRDWPARYFVGFAFVPAGALVLLATPLAAALKVDALDARWRIALVLAMLGCLAVAMVKGLTLLEDRRKAERLAEEARVAERRARAAARETEARERRERAEAEERAKREKAEALAARMRSFTPLECQVITRFVDAESRTASFIFTDNIAPVSATAHAMAKRGVLTQINQQPNMFFTTVLYSIADEYFAYFRQHPELLEPGRALTREEEEQNEQAAGATSAKRTRRKRA